MLRLTNARCWPDGRLGSISIRDGLVIGGSDQPSETIDLDGRWVLPGLWDSHVHFNTHVALSQGISLAEAGSAAESLDVLRANWPAGQGLVFAHGFKAATWTARPTARVLDEISDSRPIVALSNDLHGAWLNSAALAMFGLRSDGHLVEHEAFAIEQQVITGAARSPESFNAAVADAAARGVVGVTDYEMSWTIDEWLSRFGNGFAGLRVEVGMRDSLLERAIEAGYATGDVLHPLLRVGALKIISDGSLGSRTAWCAEAYADDPGAYGQTNISPEDLVDLLTRAHAHGWSAAVHAIGDRALVSALDAFEASGAAGSVEHAQLAPPAAIARMAALGLVASVQPAHLLDDRDTADVAWADRTQHAFPLASMLASGVQLRLGSDAPVAPLDPWLAIFAAVNRRAGSDEPWHPEQSITLTQAIEASVRTRVAVGEPADLAILDTNPSDAAPKVPVAATMVAGEFTHSLL